MSDTSPVPTYRHHKASGQAVVTIDGKDHYLGTHGTQASKGEYNRVIGEWLAGGRRLPSDTTSITVAELVAAWRRHAKLYYKDADGQVSKAVGNFDEALRPVLKLYGLTPACEFGPLRLKTCRQEFISAGRVRSNVNRHVTRVRGVFKWAVENEMIPGTVHHALMAVSGLRRGRCEVQEAEPVLPVAMANVEPVLDHVSPQVKAMIGLQLLTGMRPGEVVLMRGIDIDMSGKLWVYRPAKHKTQIHNRTREVYLGPRAIKIVSEFLKPDLSAYLFSPVDAMAHRHAQAQGHRRPGQKANERKTTRKLRDRYDVGAYYLAVQRGCDQAYPAPDDLAGDELEKWREDHRWSPGRLRHTAATELRKTHGLEAAQVILGHATLTTTQIYAEKNIAQAKLVMAQVG